MPRAKKLRLLTRAHTPKVLPLPPLAEPAIVKAKILKRQAHMHMRKVLVVRQLGRMLMQKE